MHPFSKKRTHQQAEDKYRALREVAYEITMQEFPDIEARGISYHDALAADRWKNIPGTNARVERAAWEWAKEYPCYMNKPKRFEITLWRAGILGAICLGQLSSQGTKLRMNLIESTPVRPTPLGRRALPVLSFAAAAFADIVGANEVWVLDPLPNLESVYGRVGFGNREIYHGHRVGQRRIL